MRLLRLTTLYPSYVRQFYAQHAELREADHATQQAALDLDAFGWADFWRVALAPLGYEMRDVAANVEPLQRAWARQHFPREAGILELDAIAVRQAQAFRPDILWFDDDRGDLLHRLRAEVPSIRLALGWSGSHLLDPKAVRETDLVLSCAPEAVEYYRRHGLRAEVLQHAFDPRVGARLKPGRKHWQIAFVGQLVSGQSFHDSRRKLLEGMVDQIPLTVFSPAADESWGDRIRAKARRGLGKAVGALQAVGVPRSILDAHSILRRAAAWNTPGTRLHPPLRRAMRPAVYGLAMYQTLLETLVSLNLHADSSPTFASNMRLFEATGVGTCLLTDWKERIETLFEPEREVVTFRTESECVEKARWLLDHPAEREAIARAGQARTLRDHTFARRAGELDSLIRGAMH